MSTKPKPTSPGSCNELPQAKRSRLRVRECRSRVWSQLSVRKVLARWVLHGAKCGLPMTSMPLCPTICLQHFTEEKSRNLKSHPSLKSHESGDANEIFARQHDMVVEHRIRRKAQQTRPGDHRERTG